eukprot:GHRQ01038480.1.p3 GENE.GHRQ01038480.1~~GHRQ01038480.1.p3  ORF type:complete len:101 (-),score=8.17 GHRQ01038480.1:521-823(-)
MAALTVMVVMLHAGTSACPNGVFYCRNKGHEQKLLSTSFVDDGVCGEQGAYCCSARASNSCFRHRAVSRDVLLMFQHTCNQPVPLTVLAPPGCTASCLPV